MSSEESGAERRQYPRVAWGQRGWLEAGEVTLYAAVANVSEGGLCVRTAAPLSLGTRARVRLPIGGDEVEATAEVVWERSGPRGGSGMGLRFLDLAEVDRERLRRALTRGLR